jgi:signal transduction histidine kinase
MCQVDAPEPSVALSGAVTPPIPATVVASAIQELGAPLDLISMHAELLQQSFDPAGSSADCMRSIQEIRNLAQRSRRLVRNIAHFAGMEPMNIRPLELNGVIREAAGHLQAELRLYQTTIKLELSPDGTGMWGSESQLRHALTNLIENAAEAMAMTPPAEREVEVSTRVTCEGVLIEVSDRGCEFPPAANHKVFDPFFTTKPAAMGLGLHVARGIILAHGGELVAARRSGGGMAIRISLPITGPKVRAPASGGGAGSI